jgi:hypothetical protein
MEENYDLKYHQSYLLKNLIYYFLLLDIYLIIYGNNMILRLNNSYKVYIKVSNLNY